MNDVAHRVLELLDYIEQVEKLKSKPTFAIPEDYFVAHQDELRFLPEIQFNVQDDGDDVWLRIPRLKEIAAPDLDEKLKLWVSLPKSPEKSPVLKTEAVISVAGEEPITARLSDLPEMSELFSWYVENQWNPWAAAERPRRKTIARYNKLFSLQQTISLEGAETPLELVWGIGYAAWKKDGFPTPVKYPLLLQACEIVLNEDTFDIEVRPRDVDARLDADCYAQMELPGVRQLDAFWKGALASGASRVNPFEDSTFDGVLKAAVVHLDPSGSYEVRTDDFSLPTPNDKLKITNSWVLFGRKRPGDFLLEDIRRLKQSVEAAEELPSVIRSLVEYGDSTVRVRPEQPFRGLSSSESPKGAFELYFPMPYNDEQVSIIQKLERNDGVVVQGPPGTGKTHTIANVISHYLAMGKRVLVTSKGESALAVLQEKLPVQIRPLSVALLSDERDGMKQFEHSIQTIASSVASINPRRAEQSIEVLEVKLNQVHSKIAQVDQTVADYAAKHMKNYSYQGKSVTPEEMAKIVALLADEHLWFDDIPPHPSGGILPFDDDDIGKLRRARLEVGSDLRTLDCSLPEPANFPVWKDLAGIHRDLIKARGIESEVNLGNVFALVDSQHETFKKAIALAQFLEERAILKSELAAADLNWVYAYGQRFSTVSEEGPLARTLKELKSQLRRLEKERQELIGSAINIPLEAELNEQFNEALARLMAGKSAFALPFGRGETRRLIAGVSVLGTHPASVESWSLVHKSLEWRSAARTALAKWDALAPEFCLVVSGGEIEQGFRRVVGAMHAMELIERLQRDFEKPLQSRMSEVFGNEVTGRVLAAGESLFFEVRASLQAHLDKGRLGYATKKVHDLLEKLRGCSGGIVDEIRGFLTDSVGRTSADESVLQTTWGALQDELVRLVNLRPAFAEIARVAELMDLVGAPHWAKRVRTIPVELDFDAILPATWLEAWNWRQAVIFLDKIDAHHRLRELFNERKSLTTALANTYQELVAEKTWLGVFNNSPDSVQQALKGYLVAVQAMGAGTGIRANRHRITARKAMQRAYPAVPCWVLPLWRVSETIPAEIGLFDLVVVDEASQADIWALPALLRGKKLLVVGDHKQVSPSAVGVAEEKIKQLSMRFLDNQPHGAQMTPGMSIYDLARVVFAGNSVMLKEHFRCVPAIIEFSNREFYEGDIKPLRIPKANERLDPPLVDVFVKGGFRKGDVNPPEAKAIVDEIEAIISDEAYAGRSIGVVTLLGTEQAALIQALVSERIPQSEVIARKIAVGPPPVFQGRERDIMMVSMVLGVKDRAVQNRADMFQRFNVALSRARDRTYLFRSVTESTFKEDTLNSKLIRHFRQPFRQDVRKVNALREKCESGFELEMFDELVKRGYRVQPQVPCGGYRIDFVVEGNEGRRLAIECDGDRFHGPGQWADDMTRQRVLERAGWTFWRCFASSFVRRRDEVLLDLVQTLQKVGVEPLGSESIDTTVWVHSKEVDPYLVDDAQEAV